MNRQHFIVVPWKTVDRYKMLPVYPNLASFSDRCSLVFRGEYAAAQVGNGHLIVQGIHFLKQCTTRQSVWWTDTTHIQFCFHVPLMLLQCSYQPLQFFTNCTEHSHDYFLTMEGGVHHVGDSKDIDKAINLSIERSFAAIFAAIICCT